MRKLTLLCGVSALAAAALVVKKKLKEFLDKSTLDEEAQQMAKQGDWLDRAVTENGMKLPLLGVGRILKLTPDGVRQLAKIGVFKIHWSPLVGSYVWSQDLQAFLRVPVAPV